MGVCDYVDESGEVLFFIYDLFFRRFFMRIKNPNTKRGAHSKKLTASAQKKMDDALPICFVIRIDQYNNKCYN